MLEKAREKNIYDKLICAQLSQDTEIPGCESNSYDAVVMGGAFGLAHVPIEGLLESARILKPGLWKPVFNSSNLHATKLILYVLYW